MFINFKKFILLFLLLFFFTGCIDYQETIHIFPNGWVRVSIDFKAPSVIFRELIYKSGVKFFKLMTMPRKKALKELPSSINLMEWYLDKSTADWHFHANFYVSSSAAAKDMGKIFSGQKMDVKIEDGKVDFKRFIDFTKFGRLIANMKQSKLVKRELLLGSTFRFKVITPTEIVKSNAKVQNDKTVEWDYKLLDLVAQPQIMEVVFKLPPFFYHPLFWLLYGLVSMVGYISLILFKL